MINQWMSAKEIAELPGMPSTIQGVHKKAKRDGWQQRKQTGVKGPGVEYLVEVSREQSGTSAETLSSVVAGPAAGLAASSSPGMPGFPFLGGAAAAVCAVGYVGGVFEDEPNVSEKSSTYKANQHEDSVNIHFFIEEPERFFSDVGGTLPVSPKWLKYRGFNSSDLAFYVQSGDSMAQRIKHRDIVIINSRDNRLADGYLMAVEVDGATLIRNVQKIPGGWRLNCENPRYEPITLSGDAESQCKVIGRVVRIINET
ncbi:helix-turn-helix domain-containing protein [Aeromonas hydrophila]|uniref:helix-turn-helix domain-containing protein n=1 Tax=Aeromonas hydrophila TaxID=644 RepID=UPI0015949BA5|nr:S24 family peptidase [Aeromonas hydrophila]